MSRHRNKQRKQNKNVWYMKPSNYITAVIVVLAFFGIFYLARGEESNAQIQMNEAFFDWGKIPIQGGTVSHTFPIKNTGSEALEIESIETSCMCTNARLVVGDTEGPFFSMAHGNTNTGWVGKLEPGEEGIVEVIFDPMFHGPDALGPITRTITFRTNDSNHKTVNFRLDGDVVSGGDSVPAAGQ